MIKIEDFSVLIKLLRPKYYNRITRILVVGGMALLSKPVWIDLLNLVLGGLKFSIIGEFDWLLGLIIIIVALIYNTFHRYLDLKFETENEPAFNKVKYQRFNEFGKLAQEIFPLLKDNEYIFKNTAPNSGSEVIEPLRNDLTLWEKLKKESIVPNNTAIKKLIEQNRQLIPSKYEETFNKILLHINAFDEHVKNPRFDYSEFQFPNRFSEIIFEESYKVALEDRKLNRIKKWLSKKLKTNSILDWYIFGSAVFVSSKANDIDIVIKIKNDSHKTLEYINQLKFDFKVKFRKDLHLTIFEETNVEAFQAFINKNPFRINN